MPYGVARAVENSEVHHLQVHLHIHEGFLNVLAWLLDVGVEQLRVLRLQRVVVPRRLLERLQEINDCSRLPRVRFSFPRHHSHGRLVRHVQLQVVGLPP